MRAAVLFSARRRLQWWSSAVRCIWRPFCLVRGLCSARQIRTVHGTHRQDDRRQRELPGATWIIAPLFVLIGVAIVLVGVVGSYGTEQIAERGDRLIYEYLFLGRALRSREISKNDVEEIALPADIGARHRSRQGITVGRTTIGTTSHSRVPFGSEVMIRSDNQIIRFGKHLGETDKQWLVSALTQLGGGTG